MEGPRVRGNGEVTPGELAAMEGVRLSEPDRLLVCEYWERVIGECYAQVADARRPTSWLVSRTAEQRRERRAARRAAGAVVRELPVRVVSVPDGREAA
ncbi:MAG: hypothetical protein GEV09_19055 [Pseudonocardiaceae bacterium]|nr:hypothetical protein [Pseudonocardiaceae bacterium]